MSQTNHCKVPRWTQKNPELLTGQKKKTNNQTEEIHKNKIGIALDVAEAGGWVGDKVSSIERDKSD